MKNCIAACIILLGLLSCKSEKDLSGLMADLQNMDDSLRFLAIENLEKIELTNAQGIYLLEEAVKDYPPAKYEWQSIPGILTELATKSQHIEYLPVIKNNYKNYDKYAKNEALRFLSGFDNLQAITLYKDLALQYPTEINYLPIGILNSNFSYKNTIFPALLQLIDQESTDSDVLLLLLNYLNAGELNPADYAEYTSKFISLSEKYRQSIIERQKAGTDTWDDEDYQYARFKSGILADLLVYFPDDKVLNELKNYLQLSDNKLIMFAAISLLKLGRETDANVNERIAADSECRKWFYDNLVTLRKTELFPEKYRTQEAFAESDLINWLIYPTELARMPDSIELMQIVDVDTKSDDGVVEFYLFRFMSSHENWKDNGWMAGISGYFPKKNKPSTAAYGYTFSTFEKWDDKSPAEHVREIQELIDNAYEDQ